MKKTLAYAAAALVAALLPAPGAADEVALIDRDEPAKGWKLNLGWEFPGAKGALVSDSEVEAQYRPAIRLDGDFTGGGNYVGCGREVPAGVDLESFSFWFKGPAGMEQFTLRLVDGSGQCHQFNLKCEPHGGWQRVNFPVAQYFQNAGTSSAVELVKRYEGWSGAADGKWHDPLKSVDFLTGWLNFGKGADGAQNKSGSIWIANARVRTPPPRVLFTKEVRLDDFIREGELDWGFNQGWEYPGATGGVFIARGAAPDGGNAARLRADFTRGGAYVSAEIPLNGLDAAAVRMKIKTANTPHFNVRYVDGTGQCFQGRGFSVPADGAWHDVEIPVSQVVGGERWGGANDGKWHGKARSMSIVVNSGAAADKKPEMLIADIRADAETVAALAGKPFAEDFNAGGAADALPQGWSARGNARVTAEAPFEGAGALRVERAEADVNVETVVTGAEFAAAPGPWSVSGAVRSKLYSPDNSFETRVDIVALAGGSVLETITLADQTGEAGWRKFAREVTLPAGATGARFAVTMLKTYGWADVDALSAAPLEAAGEEQVIDRIVIGSAVTGNLFMPEDAVAFDIEALSTKPLTPASRKITLTVTDYWGAEILPPKEFEMVRDGGANGKLRYRVRPEFPRGAIELGKYHELRALIRPEGFADAAEYSGFARLPAAESRRHPAREIPFTIRNWDSRIPDYFRLASRIGLRQIGTWGDSGWQTIEELGDTWYGGPSGVADVERNGFQNISEEELRRRAVEFMTKHKDNESLACVMLGNEPPERADAVATKIRAYQIAYEALKSVKPDVKVVTTSVPALERFFEAGFHKYTDVYDYHVYETYEGVRQGVRRYRELGKKYGAEKPIWCTELGLNSQGQTRHAVALEVVKKITAFFAEGGENVSWFTIMYPDGDGKARGTGGNAHNTFDSQYNRYNPRLDAIMYYNMINNITVKEFAAERQNANGVQDYLFRDAASGDYFRVLWREGGRVDVGVAVPPGAKDARIIRIDGSSAPMDFKSGMLTLGVSPEPVMLRYTFDPRPSGAAPAAVLAPVSAPRFSVPEAQRFTILKGQSRVLEISGAAGGLAASAPPGWKAEVSGSRLSVTAPAETEARSGRIHLRAKDGSGEIILTLAIMSPVSLDIYAAPANTAGEPQARLVISNNGVEPAQVDWQCELDGSHAIIDGAFNLAKPDEDAEPYLKGDTEGRATLAPGAVKEAFVSIAGSAPQTLYRIKAGVTDAAGRGMSNTRLVGGFAVATRRGAGAAGRTVQEINLAAQNFRFSKDAAVQWRGAADLSGEWTAEWDDDFLYLDVKVVDDTFHAPHSDGAIWNQDSLQFLFDPTRISAEKAGKYDYSLANGASGPQAWCHLSGDSRVNDGEVKDFKIAVKKSASSPGGMDYEIAIPWRRLLPFEPKPGANLGMNMILNEDDGDGRTGFMGWFSGAHLKDLGYVGDLILQ